MNNVIRTTIEAMAAVFGGTQSLHTNGYDEAVSLPTDTAARVARNTQLILQEESGIPAVVDPWGGSYFMESLTESVYQAANELIDEVEALGGMTKAIEPGMPKLGSRSPRRAGRRGSIRGEDVIVGVNKYRLERKTSSRSATSTTRRCASPRSRGSSRFARRAMRGGREGAGPYHGSRRERRGQPARGGGRGGAGARHRRRDLGRHGEGLLAHRAEVQSVSGVYRAIYRDDEDFERSREPSRPSPRSRAAGRACWSVKLGQDGHDRGIKVIATSFADLGFDVDVGPLFQTPAEAAQQAIDNDVHVVGVSSQAAGHKTLVPDSSRRCASRALRTSPSSSAASFRRRTTTSFAPRACRRSSVREPRFRSRGAKCSKCCERAAELDGER